MYIPSQNTLFHKHLREKAVHKRIHNTGIGRFFFALLKNNVRYCMYILMQEILPAKSLQYAILLNYCTGTVIIKRQRQVNRDSVLHMALFSISRQNTLIIAVQ